MSYHRNEIRKGVFGQISKIQEELDELNDAEEQEVKILIACELSDLYGALEGYATRKGLTMDDLKQMSDLTKKAFQSGARK